MSKPSKVPLKLKPLVIKCTDSDCKKDLHCFKATAQMIKSNANGTCRSCGADLVDWQRLHSQDMTDVEYTFAALKYELIRHHFWHVPIDQRAINYARRKGIAGLRQAVRARLRNSIGTPNNPYDGRQTPMAGSGNPIHYAQHATASCCRKCAEYWHGITATHVITSDQNEYLTELAMLYLQERIPDLTLDGEYVPAIRVL